MCDEFQTNFEAEFLADEWSDEVRNRRKNPSSKRPPARHPPRPLPPRRRATISYVNRGGFSAEPNAIEPNVITSGGSEKIRWIQECLNHKSGLQLPVNGIAGRETRSVIRDFQRKQGLRVNGLIDPDTERALREFCRQSTEPDTGDQEEIGPLDSALKWVRYRRTDAPAPQNGYLMTLAQAREVPGGGVYIMIGDANSKAYKDKILKVGRTESFARRFANYKLGVQADKWKNLRVYVAHIKGYIPVDVQIERALARLIIKLGDGALPGGRVVPEKPLMGDVSIANILPPPLKPLGSKSPHVQSNRLALTVASTPKFEVSSEFQHQRLEEMQAPNDLRRKSCSCKSCRITPCQCNGKQCPPGCSCAKCQQAKSWGSTEGLWSRQGNQIQLTGVTP